jgi:hypothetical protein
MMPRSQYPAAARMRRCYLPMIVAMVVGLASAPGITFAEEALTLKERLSDKASDDQRMDNCRVPLERRGTRPRPECADRSTAPAQSADQGQR